MDSQDPTEPEHPAYSFVRSLYRSRELAGALQRYGSSQTVLSIKRGLAADMSELECREEVQGVSHGAAVVAALVLQDLDSPAHPFTCPPTEEGQEALALLQRAVFGADSLEQRRSFTDCFLYATLGQALRAHELTAAALLDALAPHNCLSLFNAAAACGCAPLRRAARALALRSFSAAWQEDPNGLMAMEEAHLLALLSSDSLQVDSELDVFQALAAWTQYDRAARQPGLAARLARCVRLATLTMPDLHALGDHPLILADRQANQLLALTVIHLSMGQALDAPLGLPTTTRRRRCQRDDAAPAPQQEQQQPAGADWRCCGLAEHAHSSVFEAAACAFARQRAARADAAADVATASLRRLSVEGPCQGGGMPSGEPAAPGSAVRVTPGSPPTVDAPTPTATSHAAAVPALAPTSRVRHIGIGKRVSSRRTLFGMGGDDAPAKQLQAGSGGDKAATAPAAAAAAARTGSGDQPFVGTITLEMLMSPNHASLHGLAAQAASAAQPLELTNSASRKKLRFN